LTRRYFLHFVCKMVIFCAFPKARQTDLNARGGVE
jgi:hypothetical protein